MGYGGLGCAKREFHCGRCLADAAGYAGGDAGSNVTAVRQEREDNLPLTNTNEREQETRSSWFNMASNGT